MKRIHANIPESSTEARIEFRDRLELLRHKVSMLSGEDRLLMTMYIENGNSFRQMARLIGIKDDRISRRIHKVTKRLMKNEYIICRRNHFRFSREERNIAKEYFMEGLSIKKIADKKDCTYYSVRKTLKKIQKILAQLQAK